MNITSAQYNSTKVKDSQKIINVTVDGQAMSVPLDPANTDYAEIQRQVKAGTLTIKDAD